VKLLNSILILLVFVSAGLCQDVTGQATTDIVVNTKNSSVQEGLIGEHSPLVFNGTLTLNGTSASDTTVWMQIGWSINGSDKSNKFAQRYNPEAFTFIIDLDTLATSAGDVNNDSVGLGVAYFETAYDTTSDPIWNPDSSNFFVLDGNASRTWADVYVFEDLAMDADSSVTDTKDWAYPLRVLNGSFIRFILVNRSDTVDSLTVPYTFWTEN